MYELFPDSSPDLEPVEDPLLETQTPGVPWLD